MDTGHQLGLLLMYSVIVIYAVILVRISVQIFFGAAFENYKRRQWKRKRTVGGDALHGTAVKVGWANVWMPRSEVTRPAARATTKRQPATPPLLFTKAVAAVSLLIAMGVASTVAAQQGPPANTSPSDLRKQLIEIRSKEVELRIRLERIDQELKPEAIERELAGVGSVHPEELRENRRKLLTLERNGLQAELDLLEEYRASLEAAIAIDQGATALFKNDRPAPAKPSPEPQMSLALRNVRRSPSVLRLLGALSVLIMITGGLIFLLLAALQVYSQIGDSKLRRANDTRPRQRSSVQTIITANAGEQL